MPELLKDDRLDRLAQLGNVAQFVSFSPGLIPRVRHSWVRDAEDVDETTALEDAITSLFDASPAPSVNVRSFLPGRDKGCPFHYGVRSAPEVAAIVRALSADNYYTIINETLDVEDGGVSGVALGGAVEFAPDATPRVVEEGGTASLPHEVAVRLLSTVYRFEPDIPHDKSVRLEFSIHPRRVGYRRAHTVWWEAGDEADIDISPRMSWPNRFSRHVGDKAYGLVMAHVLGLPVPLTTVLGRRVAPFTFGEPTGTSEIWLRTCPAEQAPGRFSTLSHWADPYRLLQAEDPEGKAIVAVLAQEGVDAAWSGATMPTQSGEDFVQGVAGEGEAFMLGDAKPSVLPDSVLVDVRALTTSARRRLGPVRLEWVHDGRRAWVVQMHVAKHFYVGPLVLSAGEANEWIDFFVEDGLDHLREMLPKAAVLRQGILVHGDIGIASHVGDLLRKSGVPGRLTG